MSNHSGLTKTFIFSFLFILLTTSVSAYRLYQDYQHVGGNSSYAQYALGRGLFNLQTPVSVASKSLKQAWQTPLVFDITHDGTPDIVVIDTDAGANYGIIYVYDYKSLTLVNWTRFNMGNWYDFSNFWVQDLNNDGFEELTYFEFSNDILGFTDVLNHVWFNGTKWVNISQTTNCSSEHSGEGYINQISCDEWDNCTLLTASNAESNNVINICHFSYNHCNCGGHYRVAYDTSDKNTECISNIPTVPHYVDFDGDGLKDEIVIPYYHGEELSAEVLSWSAYQYNEASGRYSELETSESISLGNDLNDDFACNGHKINQRISPAWVGDFDGNSADGYEVVVVAVNLDGDTYQTQMYWWDNDGSAHSGIFLLNQPEGTIVSNIIEGEFGLSGDTRDLCYMTFNAQDDYVETFACANGDGWAIDTDFYYYSQSENISFDGRFSDTNLIHSVDYLNTAYDEVLSAYGIGYIQGSYLTNLYGISSALRGTTIAVDAEEQNLEDLIVISQDGTGLFYIDDGFYNTGCGQDYNCISSITTNPCYEYTWTNGTPVDVIVTVTDLDGDDVQAMAWLYYGSPYQIASSWSNNVSSGTPITIHFDSANHTITGGSIRVAVRDVEKQSSIGYKTLGMTVAKTGYYYGEVICTEEFSSTPPTPYSVPPSQDNFILNALSDAGSEWGLSPAYLLLLVLVSGVYAMWVGRGSADSNTTLGVIGIFLLLGVVAGVMFGIMNFGVLIVVLLAIILSVGLMLGSRFFGLGSNGGA